MTEPTTAAGRALLNDFMAGSGMLNRSAPRGSVAEQILAIEAEARQQDGSVLREALEKIESIEAGLVEAQAIADELVRRDVERAALPPSAPAAVAYLDSWSQERPVWVETPSTPPALDVERLRTAIDHFITSQTGFDVDDAEAIAAEYARLQELDHD